MNPATTRLSLTLGPVFYNWPKDKWVDFYARIAGEAPVDRVILGEVICSKRAPFRDSVMPQVAERLAQAGKEVVFATLAMPTGKREVEAIREMVSAGMLVEANDIATVHLLGGRAHVVGPFLNIYNEAALALHLALGATRVCLPPELPFESIRRMAASNDAVEVFAFGRAPLAVSARCYHARAHGVSKDACQFVCERDLDGLDVGTMDGVPFLAINGIQTLGHVVTAVTRQVADLQGAGVSSLRLSPQSCDMVKVAAIFRELADGAMSAAEASASLEALPLPGPLSDGYLRGLPGVRRLDEVD